MDSDLIYTIFSKLYDENVKVSFSDTPRNRSTDRYYCIPGKNRIRWIIPAKPQVGMPVLQQWHPFDLTSQLKWQFVIFAYRLGVLKRLPQITTIHVKSSSVMVKQNRWRTSNSQTCSPVIYVGTPGSDQKAVISLVDQKTLTIHCVIKLPLGVNAAKKNIHEARIIKRLNEKYKALGPANIFSDDKTGITGQNAVSGPLINRKMDQSLIQWLIRLRKDETTTLNQHLDPLLKQIQRINTPESDRILILMKKHLLQKQLSLPLPSVWVHGDFAPWNIKKTQHEIQAIDWEDANEDGLPLQDIFHFYYIQTYLFNEKKNLTASRSAKIFIQTYCRSLNIPLKIVPLLELFYLVSRWLKQHQEKNTHQKHFLFAAMKKIGTLSR